MSEHVAPAPRRSRLAVAVRVTDVALTGAMVVLAATGFSTALAWPASWIAYAVVFAAVTVAATGLFRPRVLRRWESWAYLVLLSALVFPAVVGGFVLIAGGV